MKIDEIHVEGFGALADLSFKDIPPGMAIILGDNEAGKTTLLAFLRSVLFGLPTRLQKDFYPPLRGGRKGGRIIISTENSKNILVERFEGKGNGTLNVTIPGRANGGQEEFHRIMGSATEELYNSVFAFSLKELQTFESLNTDKVKSAIYSAGMGVGKKTIPDVMAELQKQSRDLFAKSGSKPTINRLLTNIDSINQQLSSHSMDQDEYAGIQQTLQSANSEIKQVTEALHAMRDRQSRVQRLLEVWPQWTTLNNERDTLKELPSIDKFPADGVHRLEIVNAKKLNIEGSLRESQAKRNAIDENIRNIALDDALLSISKEIAELDRGLALYIQYESELSTLAPEALLQEQQFQQSLSELGPEWTEEKLTGFDLSISSQEDLARKREALISANAIEREQKVICSQQKTLYKETLQEQAELEELLASLPEPNLELKTEAIQQLQAGLESFVSKKEGLPIKKLDIKNRVESLIDTLLKIGPDWDEAKLKSFDTSLAVQEHVSEQQTIISDLQSKMVLAGKQKLDSFAELRDAKIQLEKSETAISKLDNAAGIDENVLTVQLHKTKTLRREFSDKNRQQMNLSHLEDRKQDKEDQLANVLSIDNKRTQALPSWLAPLVAIVGFVSVPAFGFLNEGWVEGVVLGTVLIVVAGVLFFNIPKDATSGEIDDREQEKEILKNAVEDLITQIESVQLSLEEIDAKLAGQSVELGLEGPISHPVIDDVERRLEQSLASCSDRKRLEDRSLEDKQSWKLARIKAATANKAEKNYTQKLEDAKEEWQKWLNNIGLPDALVPETVLQTLTRLDAAREQLKEIDRGRIGISQMREKITAFESQVTESSRGVEVESELSLSPEEIVAYLVDCMEKSAAQAGSLAENQRLLEASKKKTKKESDKQVAKENKYAQLKAETGQCELSWKSALTQLELDHSLKPEVAESTISAIVRSKDKYVNIINTRQRIDSLQTSVDGYLQKSRKLLQELSRTMPGNGNLAEVVSDLVRESEENEELHSRLLVFNEKLEEIDLKNNRLTVDLSDCDEDIRELFSVGECSDEDDFRRNAVGFENQQTKKETIRDLQIQIKNQVGGGMEFHLLEKELQGTTVDDLQYEKEEIGQKLDTLQSQQKDLTSEGGRLSQQLEDLEKSDEVSTLRNKLHSDISSLEDAAEQWAALKITEHIIDKAREKYERERRPDVLKEAEKFFSLFTSGAYTGLHAPLGDEEIFVRSANGKTKTLKQLSTGTAEQLYLSLRFGFVKEFVQRSEPLPLIFDDILVNFDPKRARATGEVIVKLAESLQTFFFTCQPTMVELFKEIDPNIPVFHLGNGKLAHG